MAPLPRSGSFAAAAPGTAPGQRQGHGSETQWLLWQEGRGLSATARERYGNWGCGRASKQEPGRGTLTTQVAALPLGPESVVAGSRGTVAAQGLEQGRADPRLHLGAGSGVSAERAERAKGRLQRGLRPGRQAGQRRLGDEAQSPAPTYRPARGLTPERCSGCPNAGRAHLGVAADATRRVNAGLGVHAQRARAVEVQAAGAGLQESSQVLVERVLLRWPGRQRSQPEEETTLEVLRTQESRAQGWQELQRGALPGQRRRAETLAPARS